MNRYIAFGIMVLGLPGLVKAQGDAQTAPSGAFTQTGSFPDGINQDESKVPQYTLPQLLVASDGTSITSAEDWVRKRRPEVLRLFETQMYGKTPRDKADVTTRVRSEDKHALGGKATRREVT